MSVGKELQGKGREKGWTDKGYGGGTEAVVEEEGGQTLV